MVRSVPLQNVLAAQPQEYLQKAIVTIYNEHVSQCMLEELEAEMLSARDRHEKIVVAKSGEATKQYIKDHRFQRRHSTRL